MVVSNFDNWLSEFPIIKIIRLVRDAISVDAYHIVIFPDGAVASYRSILHVTDMLEYSYE